MRSMLLNLTFALIAIAGLSPLMASGQTVIPSHINIHNGFIEVRDQIALKGSIQYAGADVVLRWEGGFEHEKVYLHHGGVIFFNKCCIPAGTRYTVTLNLPRGGESTVALRPQLCNVRGIPFGYALVVFTGEMGYDPNYNTKISDGFIGSVVAHDWSAKWPV